jgi:4-diphosphocytidyl-2-C-methyl-D-erythritol kinase
MKSVIWPAPAKLNLMLHITGQREDGYHELQTVFQFIDFSDEMRFELRDDDKIVRHCESFDVPESEDISIRAAELLRKEFLFKNPSTQSHFGVDVFLEKKIPMGAGLGGGSSDAATTLVALNELWMMGFNVDELANMGLSLGADVPVWYFVLIPPVHVSTKEVFCNPQLTRDCSAIKLCDLSRHEWRNVCTPVVAESYPMVSQAIDIVSIYSKACMSGTGASVFASFDTKAQADEVLQKIKENPISESWFSFVAKGLNQSPLHRCVESRK